MALDFPTPSNTGEIHNENGYRFVWDGSKWQSQQASSAYNLQIVTGNTKAEVVDTGSDGHFKVTTEGTERLRINSSGNVGIGTTSPKRQLHINGGSESVKIQLTNTTTGSSTDGDGFQIAIATNGDAYLEQRENSPLIFTTNNTERLRIDSTGRLCLGTSSSSVRATFALSSTNAYSTTGEINNSNVGLRLYNSNGSDGTGVNNYTGIQLNVGSGATSSGSLAYVRTADNQGAFVFNQRTGASSYAEAMRIDSSGRLLVGTSSGSGEPIAAFQGRSNDANDSGIVAITRTGTNPSGSIGELRFATGSDLNKYYAMIICQSDGTTSSTSLPGVLRFSTTSSGNTAPTERMRIDSSGSLLIGTASNYADGGADDIVVGNTGTGEQGITIGASTSSQIRFADAAANTAGYILYNHSADSLVFSAGGTERMRIDSSGRLLVRKSASPSAGEGSEAPIFIQGNTTSGSGPAVLALARGQSGVEMANGASLGVITFTDDSGNDYAQIKGACEGSASSTDHPGRITFLITPDGSSSPTERMRISNSGAVSIGTTNNSPAFNNVTGIALDGPNGVLSSCRHTNVTASFGRSGNDGGIVEFYQQGSVEGAIVVNGSSVTLSGGHLSRWSQLAGGAERTEILRGSVMSNLDEMCEWAYEARDAVLYTEEDELPEGVSVGDIKTPARDAGTEDNEQLNRMKVSDVEGDVNVSGVFMAWDDDDETYLNDFYCAMTGDFVIRIAQGTTVARGDLLTSAGDGTAKPQDDDIVRSKTIAKVTSTTVATTYTDGSYCVPCVLMAC